MSDEVFYFGCWGEPGHRWFVPGRGSPRVLYGHRDPPHPWPQIDGPLTPKTTTRQGAAALHHLDGWTAISIHDYTGDRRGNSHSTFVLHDTLTFTEALDAARERFPEVLARIGAVFTGAQPPDTPAETETRP